MCVTVCVIRWVKQEFGNPFFSTSASVVMHPAPSDVSPRLFFPTEQRDDELSGAQEAIPSQPDDHGLHHTPLLPLLHRSLCVCHLHHVEVN